MTRLDAIRQRALDEGAHGALLSHLPDIRWSVGFSGSNALLVVLPEAATLVTDGRYATQAAAEVQGARVEIAEKLVSRVAEGLVPGLRLVRQSDALTLADAYPLDAVPGVAWVDTAAFLAPLVARKTDAEIAAIARAQAVTDAVFEDLCAFIQPGTTEREIAAEIVCGHLRRGAERMSFEPIVASGPNSALPHARPTGRAVQPGDVLVLDFGCVVDGYASDMTRTVVVGEASADVRAVYDTVLRAQQAALDVARAGLTTRQLDAAARSVIAENGYGDFFPHSLGHGIGIQTHEWPRLSQRSEDVLPSDCAVTIEPGIYLPGRFGVRIEDLVVLGETGCRNLTRSPKGLLEL